MPISRYVEDPEMGSRVKRCTRPIVTYARGEFEGMIEEGQLSLVAVKWS